MAKQQIVTAPCIIARDGEGRDHYLYAGTPVPESIPAKEVARLKKLGVLGEGESEADPGPAFPDGEPGERWTVPQLSAYAEAHGIDLGGASLKADVLAKVLGTAGDGNGDGKGDSDGGTPPDQPAA